MTTLKPQNEPVSQTVKNADDLNSGITSRTMERTELDSDGSEFLLADTEALSENKSKKALESPKGKITPRPLSSSASATLKKNPSQVSRLSKPGKVPSLMKTTVNKHNLELQFINKKKRLSTMTKDLTDQQKPVVDLYENLLQIQKKLADLGKNVELEDIKLVFSKEKAKLQAAPAASEGAGEAHVSPEIVLEMKSSLEELPKTLMVICKNLLDRRSAIVKLLESVSNKEVTLESVAAQIQTLKSEGDELQRSLDAMIVNQEQKISEMMSNWQTRISEHPAAEDPQLREQYLAEQKRAEELNAKVTDLQRKLDEKKTILAQTSTEVEGQMADLKQKLKKLEGDYEAEKKACLENKARANTNGATVKSLKQKLVETEIKVKQSEEKQQEVTRKLKNSQEVLKSKENTWTKEKEELNSKIRHFESQINKITTDRNHFETRYKHAEKKTGDTEGKLLEQIENLKSQLAESNDKLSQVNEENIALSKKCASIEQHLASMGAEDRKEMNEMSHQIDWGKSAPKEESGMEQYCQDIATKMLVTQLQDQIRAYEQAKEQKIYNPQAEIDVLQKNHEMVTKYQDLLRQSESKLIEKSREVAKLTEEIKHLKMRQDHLEEQNGTCPTEDLQQMVDEGRKKLSELMKKSLENEQKIADYETLQEKQMKHNNDLENLLRFRESMLEVLKNSRDELIMDKESLTRYAQEMRSVLIEVTKEGKIKDRLLNELHAKLELREKQVSKLESDIQELERNLSSTNEKRFRLQETIGSMEKELQSTKAQVNQLAEMQTRAKLKFIKPF